MRIKAAQKKKQRGAALLTAFGIMLLIAVAAGSYITAATTSLRFSRRQQFDVTTTHMCEAGAYSEIYNLWKAFKVSQDFSDLDAISDATFMNPKAALGGPVSTVGRYTAAVIGVSKPNAYHRYLTIRSIGWLDVNKSGRLDPNEPYKVVDIGVDFALERNGVFDYTYFVNNYGWMDGFGPNDLYINGDTRANGSFNFLHGSPTVNGSVYAAYDDKLTPAAPGLINTPPVKMSSADYDKAAKGNARWRQAYDPDANGAPGTDLFEHCRDLLFSSDGSYVDGRLAGAGLCDANGVSSWTWGDTGATTQLLDSQPTSQLTLPDLSNINRYMQISQTYTDSKATYGDGTPNPTYGQGAYLKVWDSTAPGPGNSKGAYVMVSTKGTVSGSAVLVGDKQHPIILHGPVTIAQDCVIKGNVTGQGTLYAGRNIHIVGSIVYQNPPDFRGKDTNSVDNSNERKDMLGLAANGSVIMGDTSTFGAGTLQYMTPPFTHDRYDDNGNLIPAFNANDVDSTGFKKYQSVIGDSAIHSLASPIQQIDAIMYTNFVGGGNLGIGGGGVTLNGSIISKDEAMVIYSLPMQMNYDNRIRERTPTKQPLIDLGLPRSPACHWLNWQERGLYYHGARSNQLQ